MTTLTIPELLERIEYPDSDGLPMSDNTLQWYWMVLIKECLEALFDDDLNVFVAGNLLWYPVEGDNRLRAAPDVFVAIGRPKGYRGSYKQWVEGGQPPQVVFEINSPGNTSTELLEKIDFYDEHGVEEFYFYDPARGTLRGYYRHAGIWQPIPSMQDWVSPRLKIRFRLNKRELILNGPNGERFVSFTERTRQLRQAEAMAEQRGQLAEQQKQLAEQEKARADRLAEKLRALGIDPNADAN